MATYNNIGDTIEGLVLDGDTRRWQAKGLVKNTKYNQVMKLFSCDYNSHAEVTKTIGEPQDELIKNQTKDFHRALNDRLTADAIEIWLAIKGKESHYVEEGVSARHGATIFTTKGHSIAVIRTPLQNLLKKLGYSTSPQLDK
ncbi:MAG: hypothetical protein J5374_11220 [Bacteroidales bacterium]|nr:hypothetical protein [Bacteroidales bacterium]